MKLHVSHLSRYEYDQAVTFSPHVLYLRPRESQSVRVHDFGFILSPDAKLLWSRDSQDVNHAYTYFWDTSRSLSVRSEFTVETFDTNPFDFLLKPYALKFPFHYEPVELANLAPYLTVPEPPTKQALLSWLEERFPHRPADTVPFVTGLNATLYQSLNYKRRDESGIQASDLTIQIGSGACRDYAVLMVELCRSLGLAARFVSGYMYAPPEDDRRTTGAMHAWMEVYLPGAGWKGLDPTHGILCDDAFVPVAHAALAESVSPIQGHLYSSQPIRTTLLTDVRVEKLS